MVGIIAAMQIEAEHLEKEMTDISRNKISGMEFVSGKLGGKELVLAVCGIGKVFAAICAQTMILTYHPELIINTGVAGTLSDRLSVYHIAVAESVVQHDLDTTAIGDPKGMISGINQVFLPTDAKASQKIMECGKELDATCVSGIIASGDIFVSQKELKNRIVEEFGAIACEMEGASIGQVCYVNQVPFTVIRAISDSADGSSHVDYPTFAKAAAQKSAEILIRFMSK